MNKVIHFTHPEAARRQVQEEACAWLSRLDAGASDQDRERLGRWLAADPMHTEVFLETAKLWDQMTMLSALSEVFPLNHYSPPVQRPTVRRGGLLAAAAAIFFFAVFLGGMLMLPGDGGGPSGVRPSTLQAYETEVGQQRTVTLADGSEVILNTDTLIKVDYSDSERVVILERGEAYFSVARDPGRSFRVHAGERIVEAVGTAFSVTHLERDSLQVMVTEGEVRLRRLDNAVAETGFLELESKETDMTGVAGAMSLVAGENLTVNAQQDTVERKRIRADAIEVRLAWRHGMLLFQGAPLSQVLREFNRYTTKTIEADEDIRDIRVQGYYPVGDIDALLVAMRLNFQLQAQEINESHIRLTAQ